jgi:hypothetical protein
VFKCRLHWTHSILSSAGFFNFYRGLQASILVHQTQVTPPGIVEIYSVVCEPRVNIFMKLHLNFPCQQICQIGNIALINLDILGTSKANKIAASNH